MRTLLVSGTEPVPDALCHIIEQGSTSVEHVSAAELVTYVSREGLGVDRIVFWAGRDDLDVRSLAINYATAESRDREQRIFFVSAEPVLEVDGIPAGDTFVWPRDGDKLTMMFMTGG
jgi:hypothetical protein